MLTFDEDTHRYFIKGKPVPSVTQVLEPFQKLEGIPSMVLEQARERGSFVDKAIHLMIHKNLEWSRLDTALVPYVTAARKFIAENEVRILASKYKVFDPDALVAGELDVLGLMKNRTWVFDWKATAEKSRTWGPQTAAYDRLYRRNLGGTREFARAAVQLFDDGTYKLHAYSDSRDWSRFASALNCWHWLNEP